MKEARGTMPPGLASLVVLGQRPLLPLDPPPLAPEPLPDAPPLAPEPVDPEAPALPDAEPDPPAPDGAPAPALPVAPADPLAPAPALPVDPLPLVPDVLLLSLEPPLVVLFCSKVVAGGVVLLVAGARVEGVLWA
jgi:hypothetical protein